VGSAVRLLTYGCQMNEADSLAVEQELAAKGFTIVDTVDEADAIVLNTCSVRRKAEERVFGQLGHLKALKEKRKGRLVIGVVGCMAKAAKQELSQRAPYVDFVLTPDELDRILPELISRLTPVGLSEDGFDGPLPALPFAFKRYLPIMRGCDNFCTYCIVPYVRGRERSTPSTEIVASVAELQNEGVLEITLLGQNVNSYSSEGKDFPALLQELADTYPALGFRFLTSHPKDLSDELIEVMGTKKNVLPSLHLPLQAGADRILQLMNRKYTIAHYKERVAKLRQAVPDVALTTDIICGFPGETDEEFAETLAAVAEIGYSSAFMFYYQTRPGTKAEAFEGMLPIGERKARLRRLIDLQQKISKEVNQSYVDKEISVLVEQTSRRNKDVLAGRTVHDKTILFAGTTDLVGQRVKVRCNRADAWTLHGDLVS
jgi:tRNA-2-methylthio-N6-dimethylallyladenosine synthase